MSDILPLFAVFNPYLSPTTIRQFCRVVFGILSISVYLYTRLGTCDGISFIDSTRLRVCENRHIAFFRKKRDARKLLWSGSMVLNFIC